MTRILRQLGRSAASTLRWAGALASIPATTTAAVLGSPGAAKADPQSQRLVQLRRQGWRPTELRLLRHRTELCLERGGERCSVEGETLAFAAYASLVAARGGAWTHRVR